MLHHISLPVADLSAATRLYAAVLAPLGGRLVYQDERFSGFGITDDEDILGLRHADPAIAAGPGFHLAFAAPSRTAVDAFYAAALAHGALDNGAPGVRAAYGPNYYAAFVIDHDGHRIEAVFKGE
jgi:catechol 2,3-dioxygenase-like lactoylglutathione lyase family enzyme